MITDYNKYKRVFAFGCSFTHYRWPTWADLIFLECKNAKFYNFGKAGLGNLGIASKIIEANKRFCFNDEDLVLIMWSTFCREDRWLAGTWYTMGCVYNSQYPKEFIQNFTDPIGYLVRDYSLISMTNSYINNLSCDNVILKSTPFNDTEIQFERDERALTDLELLYKEEYNTMPLDFKTFNKGWHPTATKFIECNKVVNDGHPMTGNYFNYLKILGFDLSEETKKISDESDRLIESIPDISMIDAKYRFLRIEGTILF